MTLWRRKLMVAGVSAGLLCGSRAFGFCLMTTCDTSPMPEACQGSRDELGCSDEGQRLAWARPCFSFSVGSSDAERDGITARQLEVLVNRAFEQWQRVSCAEGRPPGLLVEQYPKVDCSDVGYDEDGPNQNLWVFRNGDWPAEEGEGAIALTTLAVDPESGEILDADVELNAGDNRFTLTEADVAVDLASIVQHEAGHVLGIHHSRVRTSTMASGYDEDSIEPRTLEQDDIEAVCTLMPSGKLPALCDTEPYGGFSTQCAAEPGCCALAPGRKTSRAAMLLALWLAQAAWLRRRCCRPNPKDGLRRR